MRELLKTHLQVMVFVANMVWRMGAPNLVMKFNRHSNILLGIVRNFLNYSAQKKLKIRSLTTSND